MKVRCLSDYLTEQQRATLGRRPYQGHLEWGVTIGVEYLVLGLTFEFDLEHAITGLYVYLLLRKGDVLNVRHYDLSLFTITEPRASRYWEVRAREFDGRQIVEVLSATLADGLYPHLDAKLDSQGEDDAWFVFLDSEAFRHLCGSLAAE